VQKVSLNPAETKHVHLDLNARAFSYWDVTSHSWRIAPGDYRILVGSTSRDIRLRGTTAIAR
jgi:beta-glucosidase